MYGQLRSVRKKACAESVLRTLFADKALLQPELTVMGPDCLHDALHIGEAECAAFQKQVFQKACINFLDYPPK